MLDVGLELNVLFDDPFWIGVFYLTNGDKCYVERVVFGQEPSDGEIYVYFLNNYHKLNFVAEFKAKHFGTSYYTWRRSGEFEIETDFFFGYATLLLADGGSASVCGLDVVKDYKAIRRRV